MWLTKNIIGLIFLFSFAGCVSSIRFSSAVEPIEFDLSKDQSTLSDSLSQAVTSADEILIPQIFKGIASYYSDRFHGRKTASGELYDKNELTAAHRTLPFGTVLKVTNSANGLSVIVRVNDRGPVKTSRIIDLSKAAAEAIDMIRDGLVEVEIELIR